MITSNPISKMLENYAEMKEKKAVNLTKVFTASEYVNIVTGSNEYKDIEYYEDIDDILKKHNLNLWNYCLFDIEEAYHNSDNLVLISARYKSGFIDTPEIRLTEVPSEIDTTKY